ncbi:unannotated protein [freshwater metagenome]|uniref:Unannotated protein n=1 Tax=freshwater metagenome TaxID=449393 RepID=A0A6J6IC26_9ZZZZ
MQDQRKFVDISSISSIDNRFCIDVAHMRYFSLQATTEGFFAATHNDVGLNSSRTKFGHTVLSGLRLLLTTRPNKGHQSDMEITHIVASGFIAKLANRLEERQNLNVAYRATHFGNHDVCIFSSYTTNPPFDFVGDVRNNLHSLSEIVATALCGQHSLINRTSCRIGTARQVLVDKSLVVTQVEVSFSAIIGHKYFSVFKRIHGAGVNIDVGIKLLHRDP